MVCVCVFFTSIKMEKKKCEEGSGTGRKYLWVVLGSNNTRHMNQDNGVITPVLRGVTGDATVVLRQYRFKMERIASLAANRGWTLGPLSTVG